jgi:hypothetical protein
MLSHAEQVCRKLQANHLPHPRGPGIVAFQPAAQAVLRANTALHIANEILR